MILKVLILNIERPVNNLHVYKIRLYGGRRQTTKYALLILTLTIHVCVK